MIDLTDIISLIGLVLMAIGLGYKLGSLGRKNSQK